MNEINKEEMFGNLKSFLKAKGIDLQEGSYSDGIRKGCEILTDTVNLSQRALDRAKVAVDKGLTQVKQTIHEKTAPKAKSGSGTKKTASGTKASHAKTGASRTRSAKTKASSAKAGKKRSK
jgi:hypothetical protein